MTTSDTIVVLNPTVSAEINGGAITTKVFSFSVPTEWCGRPRSVGMIVQERAFWAEDDVRCVFAHIEAQLATLLLMRLAPVGEGKRWRRCTRRSGVFRIGTLLCWSGCNQAINEDLQ